MNNFKLANAAIAALACCVGVAQATPLVTDWTVTDTATFVPASVQPGGGGFNPVLTNGNTQLHWGDAAQQSGLIITNSGGSITVPTGSLTSTVQITHDNFPIPAGNSLTSVDILATLTLQALNPANVDTLGPTSINFGVHFLETTNEPGNICADGGTNHVGININGCADIFVIQENSLNFPFIYDSNQYFLSFFANGFGTLSDAACISAGAASGCRGFETAENGSTTADFKLLITSTPFQVPEPGSLALIGGALAAMAWIGRRKQLPV